MIDAGGASQYGVETNGKVIATEHAASAFMFTFGLPTDAGKVSEFS